MKFLVDIVIPVLNEQEYILKCLKTILDFELPKNVYTKIYVLDGGSNDNTVKIIKSLSNKNIIILKNKGRIQSCAMNIAINQSSADYIMRLDAHSIYPNNYLKLCFESMIKTKASNVGGIILSRPGSNRYGAKVVQSLTTHPFGVGDSGFRTNIIEDEVDTVPFGFFKRNIFEKIGFFDERLVRAQDYEFNKRILNSGGKIWLNPEIVIKYFNQDSFYKFIKKQLFLEAPYNAYMWYLAPYTFVYRHAITGVFVIGLIGGILLSPIINLIKYIFLSVLILYFSLAFLSSFQQAKRYNNFFHFITLPFSFFIFHVFHGLGVIIGLIMLLIRKSPVQKIKEPWKGYGFNRVKTNNSLK